MRTTVHTVIAALATLLLASCGGGSSSSAPDGIGANWTIPANEVVDGGPGQDGIPSIDDPVFGSIDDPSLDFLREDDYIAAVSVGGEILAFPHPILNYHEVVNVKVGSDDFVVSYCPLTGTALAWDVDNSLLNPEFGVSGLLYNSNLILYDRSTGSHWSQMLQKSVRGARVGEVPDRIQVIETTWATWKAMYPDSKVLTTDTGHERDYFAYPYGNYRWNETLLFPVSTDDNRLHPKRRVIGMRSGSASKVFQIDVFPPDIVTLQQQFNGQPVVIIGDGTADISAIYSRELADGTILDFRPVRDQLPIVMMDSEGNTWDIFGSAVSGPRAGEQLALTESYTALWFAWATFFDNTQIHFN
jgi:hypothetical protein